MSTSVLIVNFRGYGDLERCLQSLGRYLRTGDEVIVVDNESDGVQLKALARRCPGIRIIQSARNLGFAAGINVAARQAQGAFLLMLNPDTVVDGPVISVLEEWLRRHRDTAVVGPRVLNIDGSVQPSARAFPGFSTLLGGRSAWMTRRFPNNPWSKRNLLGVDALEPLDVDWLSGSCLMTRREVFEHLGGLDESFFLYWEDADYCRRVAQLGLNCTYLPTVPVRHFCGGSARYNVARAVREFHVSAYRLYYKHCGLVGRIAAPMIQTGLHVRGEFRARHALATAARAGETPAREPGCTDLLQNGNVTLELDASASG